MKKLYVAVVLLLIALNLKSQSELWGVAPLGAEGFGALFSMPTGSTGFSFQRNFSGAHGQNPQQTRLVQASNGKFYGTTFQGGVNSLGVIFEYDASTNVYTKKWDFAAATGSQPRGPLMQASNGKLYGMTVFGGANSVGVIYEFDISTGVYTKKVDLSTANGSGPFGTLMELSTPNGKLYGLTRAGGANGVGAIFEYDLTGGTYTKKIDLSSALGSQPGGEFVQSGTMLYALCQTGGTATAGAIIEYDYTNNICTKKIDLNSTIGSSPQGAIIKASDGNLYGLTVTGGTANVGVIFQYSISTNTYNKLFDFNSTIGSNPPGRMVQSSANGKLYGVTRIGGANNQGVIFEFDYTTSTYVKKLDLSSTNTSIGGSPLSSPIFGSNGKLYGPLTAGGIGSGGVIFEYDITTSTYAKKIDLNVAPNGGNPNGGLVYAGNGKLYGTTVNGGTNNNGTIYEYDRTTATFTKKVDLISATSGANPYSSMIEASNAKLYGVTSAGGTNGVGTIYEYDYGNNTFTKKIDLSIANGTFSPGPMIQSSINNKLYGVTSRGGSGGVGVLFEYDYSTNTYTKRVDFVAGTTGQNPVGSLVEAPNGKLFGMTQLGGANSQGVIFEFDVNTNTYTKKFDFNSTSGTQPLGSLVLAGDGFLYGLTTFGGNNSLGSLFQYDYVNNALSKKIDLSSTLGSSPNSSLVKAANNRLYAILTLGGTNNLGTIAEYDVTGATLTKLIDLSASSSYSPAYTRLTEVCIKPAAAGSITSSTNNICESSSSTQNFSIATIPTASSYTWSLPSGAAITSGSLTNSLATNLSSVVAGVYSYSVRGVNVCGTGSLSVASITVNPSPTLTVNSGTICSGNSFTMNPSGATTYTYSSGSAIVAPLTNTFYTIAGTSSLGCPGTTTSNITVNITPTIAVNSGSFCTGNSFTIVPGGASTYTISGGSAIVSPPSNTSYSVTGTSAQGCVGTNTAVSSVVVNITPTVTANSGTICSGNSFTIIPGGASTYTYSGGTSIVTPSATTFYNITGTSTEGCVSGNIAISNVSVNITPTIAVTSGVICSGNSFTMVPSGANTYTFSSGSAIVSPVTNTFYNVTGTSAQGCVGSNTAISNVTVNTTPVITVNSGSICTGNSFTMVPGGASTYTLSSGTAIVSPLVNTSYNVTGTSAEGCVGSNTAVSNVTVNITPTIGVTSGTICTGNSFTMVPSGANTYTYSSGSAIVSPMVNTSYNVTGTSLQGCIGSNTAVSSVVVNITPTIGVNSGSICTGNSFTMVGTGANTYTYSSGAPIVSPLLNTSYNVTGTSAQGCVGSNTAVSLVTVNITPTITAGSGTICSGNSFTIIPGGASTYTYSSGSAIVSPLINSTYSVTGTSAQGCIGTNTAVSSVVVNITPTIGVNSGVICSGNTFTMVPNGANTYTYSSGTAIVSPSITSSYSITGTSAQGCIGSNTAISSVSVNITPTITVNSGSICTGNSFTMLPGGANTYTYSSGSAIVSPLVNSSYSVIGTSAQGCIGSNTAVSSVTVNITPTISVNSGSICSGNSFTLIPGGASTYTYSSGLSIVSPLANTFYSVTGTSAEGCVSSNTAVSIVAVNITPTVTAPNGTICSGNSFTITPFGASTYTFAGGSAIVSPVAFATYTVNGTSAQGCVGQTPWTTTITVNITPTITVNSGSICTGNTFTIIPNGASTYTFSSGTPIVSPTINTTYFVNGTSAEGCIANTVLAVSNVTVFITPTITVNSGSICSGDSFTLIPGGANTYTYSGGSAIVAPLINTSYTVSGTSAQGCVNSNTAISNVTVNIRPTIGVNTGSICTGGSFTLAGNGASSYTYSSGSPVVSPLVNTTYSVTGTSSLGCVGNNTAVSIVSVNITPTISVNSGTICSGQSFTMVPSGANTYTISGGSAIVSPLNTTPYNVTGTSAQGCVGSNTAISNVTVYTTPTVSINSGNICFGNSITLTPSINPNGLATYTISGGSYTVSPASNSSYSITATNALGCVSQNTAVASVNVFTLPVVSAVSGSVCSGLAFTPTVGGANSYTYSAPLPLIPTVNTTYSVIGSNAATGCISNPSTTFAVVVNARPSISISGSNTVCLGSALTLSASGANTFTWSSGTGSTTIVTPSVNSTYSVAGTSAAGCNSTAVISVSVLALPNITVTGGGICTGGTFTLSPSGAINYTFLPNGPIVTPTATTVYSINGVDANGCSMINPITTTVTVGNTLSVAITGDTFVCLGETVNLTASGATTYSWSTNSTQNNIVVTPTVNTSYTVLGSSGSCSAEAVVEVTVNPLPNITTNTSNSLICSGQSVTILASGASNYTWNVVNQPTTTSIVMTPINTTTFTLIGSDLNGCENSIVVTQSVQNCLGLVQSFEKDNFLNIFPNPNSGQFSIETTKNVNMIIYNHIGEVILKDQLEIGIHKIELSEKANGIYLVRIIDGDRDHYVRVIKE